MKITWDILLGKPLLHKHSIDDISGLATANPIIEITATAVDETNGYITVPAITLTEGYTKVIRGGSSLLSSERVLNSPAAGQISFGARPVTEGDSFQIFN